MEFRLSTRLGNVGLRFIPSTAADVSGSNTNVGNHEIGSWILDCEPALTTIAVAVNQNPFFIFTLARTTELQRTETSRTRTT